MTVLRQLSRIAAANQPPVIVDEWHSAGMTGLVFESEPYAGKPTEVFAYIARPPATGSPLPAMVLVHGGGGTAFAQWATMWAQRGYIAIAMDLVGHTPVGAPLRRGWPYRGGAGKFWGISEGVDQSWVFHAVAAVMHSISLIAAQPDVDADSIYLNGISWGSHVAELTTSIDSRVAGAAFLYGSGFLRGQQRLAGALDEMPVALANLWELEFDSKNHAAFITSPTLWITGARDHAYAVTSFQRTADLANGPTVLRITPGLAHSHNDGWAPTEICEFFNHLRGIAPSLPAVGSITESNGQLTASYNAEVRLVFAEVHYTRATTPWPEREWNTELATIGPHQLMAQVPFDSTATLLTLTDARGMTTSSRLLELHQ